MARIFFSSISGSISPSTPFISSSLSSSSSSFSEAMMAKIGRTQSYWASIESDIEAHLKKVISIRPPESVFEPMHYLTFTTPKSTAPALCIAACELVGGDRDQAMDAASAIHLMHVAAYTHQHMAKSGLVNEPELGPDGIIPVGVGLQAKAPGPARKDIEPEIEHKFGLNIELLTGDGIMPFGMELLARGMSPARKNSDKILRAITEVTRAFGSQGQLEGQYREIEWSELYEENEELFEYVCKKKEGGIHACGCACGAILGDGSDEEIERLRNYGLYVGIIQGITKGKGRNNKKRMEKRVNELRVLAMEELNTSFKGKKLMRQIASLVEESFS